MIALFISNIANILLQYITVTLICIYVCNINKSCPNEHINRYSVLTSDCQVAGRDAVDIDRDLNLCPN